MSKTITSEPCACMSASPLERILEREAMLGQRVEEAAAQAAQMVSDAQNAVVEIHKEADAEGRALADVETGRIAQETQERIEEIEALRTADAARLRHTLEANVAQTVDYVLGVVLGNGEPALDRSEE